MFPKEREKGKRVLRRYMWGDFLKAASRPAVSRSPGKKKERQKRAEGVFKEIMAEKAKWKYKLLICVQLFSSPWSVAHQAPLSMEFSRQE